MLNNRNKIVKDILIGSILFLCLILLIIIFYLLYRYRRKSISLPQKFNDQEINVDQKEETKINQSEKEENVNNQIQSDNMEKRPTIIEELMTKSLQLAKTAEEVAKQKEKRFTLKDNIHSHL